MAPTKKYKLFSTSSGETPPCAFFASSEGCRMGDSCRFLHSLPDAKEESPNGKAESSSVVSSESEGDEPVLPAPSPPKKVETNVKKEKKSKKRKSDGDAGTHDSIFVKPKRLKENNATPSSKSCNPPPPKETPAVTSPPPKSPASSAVKVEKRQRSHKKASTPTSDFRSLNLPVSSFSTSGEVNSPAPPSTKVEEAPSPPVESSSPPLPKSTPTALKWQKALLATRQHPRYIGSFDFEKSKELDELAGRSMPSHWIKARPFGDWCANNPQAIAIDCEMCETRDPVTGTIDGKALCRLSVVNAENPSEVLLDTLVKPAWPVVDYRTRINGIKEEHLETVQFTLRHAQAFMMALCSEETIFLGHALHNDLVALRMEHYCNIDSAVLFQVKDAPGASPSLKDLAKGILKKAMPDMHDSVNDARTALGCLETYLEKDGKVEPIERSERRNSQAASQLFVHRIPKACKVEHLSNMFLEHTRVNPEGVADLEFNGSYGKTLVTFSSPRHARLAFDTLEGPEEAEASGRMQKKIYLSGGGYIRVRKMVHERPSSAKTNDSNNSGK